MKLEDEVELLRRIPLFAKLEPSRLKLLAFTSERMAFEPGQDMFHQGDIGDAAYLILSGEADVLVDTPSGPITVASVGKNALVGEISILCDAPRNATVRPTAKLDALKIKKEHFLRLITEFPEMAIEVMRVLANRVSATNEELSAAKRQLRELAG
ncbi:cAMP-binding proteins - catabolite gene activator and regulatory subunit of cAMP-dependent protein kinases [hydrothermal vent metagenome]|uniref:cAMP-binding proteins - catabolite gene activator and regulatory subunit of cAMP-dependent protein kinases n=1 Tax=hydrothermal vent metagenome TaxID=652676 RepID=A0A3B0TD74_9ZZZZ